MITTTILRRVVGQNALNRQFIRNPAQLTCTKLYSTPSEPDPQLNGYPQLPWVSRQHLPARGWQDSLLRRNFGDTLHEQEEVLSMWGPDIPPVDPRTALRQLLIAATGFVGIGLIIKYVITQDLPAIRREYPFSGLVTELGGLEENKARAKTESE